MELNLKNKVAIVTGASKGIGLAVARALASEGAKVCMVSRNPEDLERSAQKIKNDFKTDVVWVSGDVKDKSLTKKVIDTAVSTWGRLDILVNNAGGPTLGGFQTLTDEMWEEAMEQNFLSSVRFTRECLPHMQKNNWGRILNITSTLAKEPAPVLILSGCTRAALASFVKASSLELAPMNITINSIAPGSVQTDRATALITKAAEDEGIPFSEMLAKRAQTIPVLRFAQPEEIAHLAAFLASDKASYITGTTIVADGGITKGLY